MSFGPGGWDPFQRAVIADVTARWTLYTVIGYVCGKLFGPAGVVAWLFTIVVVAAWTYLTIRDE